MVDLGLDENGRANQPHKPIYPLFEGGNIGDLLRFESSPRYSTIGEEPVQ
jgi:hypothetical protein